MPADAAMTGTNKTFFAPGTVFEGTLKTPGDVEIAGEVRGEIVAEGKVSLRKVGDVSIASRDLELLGAAFKGDVTVEGAVIVDRESTLQGNVRASSVLCEGEIRGNLNVSEYVDLGERATVVGDIRTASMDIARGARLNGQVRMDNIP